MYRFKLKAQLIFQYELWYGMTLFRIPNVVAAPIIAGIDLMIAAHTGSKDMVLSAHQLMSPNKGSVHLDWVTSITTNTTVEIVDDSMRLSSIHG